MGEGEIKPNPNSTSESGLLGEEATTRPCSIITSLFGTKKTAEALLDRDINAVVVVVHTDAIDVHDPAFMAAAPRIYAHYNDDD